MPERNSDRRFFEKSDGRAIEVPLAAGLAHEARHRRIDDVGIIVQFLVDGLFANVFAVAEYAFGHFFLKNNRLLLRNRDLKVTVTLPQR